MKMLLCCIAYCHLAWLFIRLLAFAEYWALLGIDFQILVFTPLDSMKKPFLWSLAFLFAIAIPLNRYKHRYRQSLLLPSLHFTFNQFPMIILSHDCYRNHLKDSHFANLKHFYLRFRILKVIILGTMQFICFAVKNNPLFANNTEANSSCYVNLVFQL